MHTNLLDHFSPCSATPGPSANHPCQGQHNFDESTAGSFIGLGFSTLDLVKLCAGAVRRYHCTTGGGSRRRARGRQQRRGGAADGGQAQEEEKEEEEKEEEEKCAVKGREHQLGEHFLNKKTAIESRNDKMKYVYTVNIYALCTR